MFQDKTLFTADTTIRTTKLLSSISTSDTSIDVEDTEHLPSSGIILIDSEQISYTAITNNTLTCTRASNGTTAANHSRGAVVTFITAINNTATAINDGSNINSSVTTITVDSTTGFSTTGSIKIENEVISYTGLTLTTFTGCTRGAESTTAATHNNDIAVNQYIGTDTATITVDSTNGFLNEGYIKIDDEIISYTGLGSTTFTGCSRGVLSQTAATHSDNAVVYQYASFKLITLFPEIGTGIKEYYATELGKLDRLTISFFDQNGKRISHVNSEITTSRLSALSGNTPPYSGFYQYAAHDEEMQYRNTISLKITTMEHRFNNFDRAMFTDQI